MVESVLRFGNGGWEVEKEKRGELKGFGGIIVVMVGCDASIARVWVVVCCACVRIILLLLEFACLLQLIL